MPKSIASLKVVLLFLAMLGLSAGFGVAKDVKEPNPPFEIAGFDYSYYASGQIHMNVCRENDCIPGSKVSYTLFEPETNPDYQQFTFMQQKVAEYLQEQAPAGTTVKIEKQERRTDQLGTTFTSSRVLQSPDGKKLFTTSTTLFMKTMSISVISSSVDKAMVTTNGKLFWAALLARIKVLKQTGMPGDNQDRRLAGIASRFAFFQPETDFARRQRYRRPEPARCG